MDYYLVNKSANMIYLQNGLVVSAVGTQSKIPPMSFVTPPTVVLTLGCVLPGDSLTFPFSRADSLQGTVHLQPEPMAAQRTKRQQN